MKIIIKAGIARATITIILKVFPSKPFMSSLIGFSGLGVSCG